MIWTNKKGERTVDVADPDLCGASVEIEEPFFGDFGCRIGRANNLDTDLRSALEKGKLWDMLFALRSEPGDVDGSDACGDGDWALGKSAAVREKLAQTEDNFCLTFAVQGSRWRTHEDVAVLVGLDAIREPGELGISENPRPSSQVEGGLGLKLGKLDRDRHEKNIR